MNVDSTVLEGRELAAEALTRGDVLLLRRTVDGKPHVWRPVAVVFDLDYTSLDVTTLHVLNLITGHTTWFPVRAGQFCERTWGEPVLVVRQRSRTNDSDLVQDPSIEWNPKAGNPQG